MNTFNQIICKSIFCAALFFLVSCEPEAEQKTILYNSFSMYLNDDLWKPTSPQGDSCLATFYCETTEFTDNPIYTLWSYKDKDARSDAYSENQLRMNISGVFGPKVYYLTSNYKKQFEPYAIFVVNGDNFQKRYVNSENDSSFLVEVEKMYPVKNSLSTGIGGTFGGVLYNEADPLDSIVINKGRFTFYRANYYNQCIDF